MSAFKGGASGALPLCDVPRGVSGQSMDSVQLYRHYHREGATKTAEQVDSITEEAGSGYESRFLLDGLCLKKRILNPSH